MAHKSDQDLPPRLNSLDCFMITKATRKYEKREVITLCTEGELDGGFCGGAFICQKILKMTQKTSERSSEALMDRQLKKVTQCHAADELKMRWGSLQRSAIGGGSPNPTQTRLLFLRPG